MLLKDLLPNVDNKFADIEILGITSDSREIKEGYASLLGMENSLLFCFLFREA